MPDVTVSRTLVKSPPELWSECSDAASLAHHLDRFGEIRITRLEPETAVAWEGERASGTVRLEPSGWGTRVVLTATPAPAPNAAEAEEAAGPAPAEETAVAPSRRGWLQAFLAVLARRRRDDGPPAAAEPELTSYGADAEPVRPPELRDADDVLKAALDSLGRAHHRPFSRAG